jgi:hypothetical protein
MKTPFKSMKQLENFEGGFKSEREPDNLPFSKMLRKPSSSLPEQLCIKIVIGLLDNGSTFIAGPEQIKNFIFEIAGLVQESLCW